MLFGKKDRANAPAQEKALNALDGGFQLQKGLLHGHEGLLYLGGYLPQLGHTVPGLVHRLGDLLPHLEQAEVSFGQITSAADGALTVQDGIAGVIQASQQELQVLCQYFDHGPPGPPRWRR